MPLIMIVKMKGTRRFRSWGHAADSSTARPAFETDSEPTRQGSRSRPYNAFVITRGIRELVARDWDAARRNKEHYWGERIGRLGATEGFRVAEDLRRQMLQRDPGWPDAETR